MKHRAFDLVLLIVVLSGGILAWQTGRERSRLEGKRERLVRTIGDLPIADPSKVYVRALKTGEPMHFAWRVYLPPNYIQLLSASTGNQGNAWPTRSSEFVARVRLHRDEQGVLQVYTQFSAASSRLSLGDKTLAELLRDRWDKIRVEQLGAAGLTAIEPDQSAVLLRLTLPDDLLGEARKKLSPYAQQHNIPFLFELALGKASRPSPARFGGAVRVRQIAPAQPTR